MRPFGELVRRKREALGITQKELSLRTGLSQSMISQIETGDRGLKRPGLGTRAALERELGPLAEPQVVHPSLQRFLDSALGKSLGITAEERAGLNRAWFDDDEEPDDEAWYEFLRARRRLHRRQS